jgi:hypothetical protein
MGDCLHCEINDVVMRFVEKALKDDTNVNVVEVMSMMAESIVDVILQQEDVQQGNLLAEAMRSLGHLFLEKSGAIEGESTARH